MSMVPVTGLCRWKASQINRISSSLSTRSRRLSLKDLDLENCWWTIPGEVAKNGLSHRVPLTSTSLNLLKRLQPITGDSRWVFPSPTVKGQHIN